MKKNAIHANPEYDYALYQIMSCLTDMPTNRLLKELQDPTSKGYGGNSINVSFEDDVVVVSSQFSDIFEEPEVLINKTCFIQIIQIWLSAKANGADKFTVLLDDTHMMIIVEYGNEQKKHILNCQVSTE